MTDLLSDPLLVDLPVHAGYRVLEPCLLYGRIGRGGMGSVYRGRHLNLDIDVAVKCLRKSLVEEDDELVVRFQREARVAAAISSENLVRVFDVGRRHGVHFLVMELVEGETARQRVKRKGPLAPPEAATILLGAARGLAAAHARGIVHRDVKPDNILIARSGEVKLADLGLARAAEAIDSLQTATQVVMGTPQYMPPEQFRSAASAGPPADVWALGATLYYLLCGRDGIQGGPLTEIMWRVVHDGHPSLAEGFPDAPPALIALVADCIRPDPADRPAEAREIVTRLEAFLRDSQSMVNLADPHCHLGDHEGATVSPPPHDTVASARAAAESGRLVTSAPTAPLGEAPTVVPTRREPAPSEPRRRESARESNSTDSAPTLRSAERAPASKARRSRTLLFAALAILPLIGLGWFLFGRSPSVEKKDAPKESPRAGAEEKPEGKQPTVSEPTRSEVRNPLDDLKKPAETSGPSRAPEEPVEKEKAPVAPPPPLLRAPRWADVLPGSTTDAATGLPTEVIHRDSGIRLVLIKPGEYERGAAADDDLASDIERPSHRVRISRAFYLGKFEVTNAELRRFHGIHASGTVEGFSLEADRQPAARVSLRVVELYCEHYGLRLPTEAEWEYAARAGKKERFPWGKSPAGAARGAAVLNETLLNFSGMKRRAFPFDGGLATAEVGSYPANAWGLHDVIGNVAEYCSDHLASYTDGDTYKVLGGGTLVDPHGPARGSARVLRGGSILDGPATARLSARISYDVEREDADTLTGFRVACDP